MSHLACSMRWIRPGFYRSFFLLKQCFEVELTWSSTYRLSLNMWTKWSVVRILSAPSRTLTTTFPSTWWICWRNGVTTLQWAANIRCWILSLGLIIMDITLHSWKRRLLPKVKVTPIYLLIIFWKAPACKQSVQSIICLFCWGRYYRKQSPFLPPPPLVYIENKHFILSTPHVPAVTEGIKAPSFWSDFLLNEFYFLMSYMLKLRSVPF